MAQSIDPPVPRPAQRRVSSSVSLVWIRARATEAERNAYLAFARSQGTNLSDLIRTLLDERMRRVNGKIRRGT